MLATPLRDRCELHQVCGTQGADWVRTTPVGTANPFPVFGVALVVPYLTRTCDKRYSRRCQQARRYEVNHLRWRNAHEKTLDSRCRRQGLS